MRWVLFAPANDERETLADHLAMGVPNIWLIDPISRAAFIFDAAGLHEADPTRLTVPNTPIHLDLTDAFASLDEGRLTSYQHRANELMQES